MQPSALFCASAQGSDNGLWPNRIVYTAKIGSNAKVRRHFILENALFHGPLSLSYTAILGRRLITNIGPAHLDVKTRQRETLLSYANPTRYLTIFNHKMITRLRPVVADESIWRTGVNFTEAPA